MSLMRLLQVTDAFVTIMPILSMRAQLSVLLQVADQKTYNDIL